MASYFKDHIKEAQLLTDAQHREVLNDSISSRNGSFYKSLLKKGFLEEEVVLNEACKFFGYKRIEDPFKTKIDFEATFKIRNSIYKVIEERQFAVTVEGKTWFVLADPEKDSVKSSATTALGFEPQFALISQKDFDVFAQYQLKPKENEIASSEVIKALEKAQKDNSLKKTERKLSEVETTAAQKLLDNLLACAIERRASDLHIIAMGDNNPAMVKLRVDGALQFYTYINGNSLENLRNLLRQMCGIGGENPNAPVEGQLNYKYKHGVIDTRINIIKTVSGYDFVLRFIASHMRTMEELGVSDKNLTLLRRLGRRSTGLVLFVGGTGSGKTTTEYSMLREMHEANKKVHTIEDPVEIIFHGITQVNLPKPAGNLASRYSVEDAYEQAIASALRHDPDVLVIGEIRGRKVAKSAIQAADTGHLVLSTMHANDSYAAIARLYELEIKPFSLGEVLSGIVAQKLVRRICPHCKNEYELALDSKYRKMFNLGNGPIKHWKGRGCAVCAGEGYLDRVVVSEILMIENEVRDAIQTEAPRSVMQQAMKQNGFRSYLDDGIDKVLCGITTFEEVEEKIFNDMRGNEHFIYKEDHEI